MLRKIACNATNSAAIDSSGNVFVWGAGKYGLLG
jgi:alpha-tubulin suppressor-like RCC1 family protein